VGSRNEHFLLLARPPWPRYRFEAEVRQETARGVVAQVGLIFGHQNAEVQGVPVQSFYQFHFADCGLARGKMSAVLRGKYLTAKVWREPHRPLGVGGVFKPVSTAHPRGEWRRLAVEVTPESVRFLWTEPSGVERLIGERSAAELHGRSRNQFDDLPDIRTPDFIHGPVGIFVTQTDATFRRVFVRQLGPD
jgi:hypothetical protein